jgi:hypothetical protein
MLPHTSAQKSPVLTRPAPQTSPSGAVEAVRTMPYPPKWPSPQKISAVTIQWVGLHQYQQTLHFSALSPIFTLPLTIPSVVANHFVSKIACTLHLYMSRLHLHDGRCWLVNPFSLPSLHPNRHHFTSALSGAASITELALCNIGSFSEVAPIRSSHTNFHATSRLKYLTGGHGTIGQWHKSRQSRHNTQ